ncbi:metabotropic glutamate receptor 4-like [Amphiura filiformis]|uniref:metabotropic glutamate receptor 4-like n=1 Tax=Amphiura filiformis TaxID=82378 RepID=UPI003B21E215
MTMTSSVGRYEYAETCPDPDQKRMNSGKVIGVIGTERSSSSILAANTGRVVTVPVISYWATSDELSDSKRFPFFFRTIPPDKLAIKVIVDILRHYNWKYIALFYSLDSYGIHGTRQIVQLADIYDICIAMIMPVASEREIEEIAQRLSEHKKVTVIVSFSVWNGALAVLKAVKMLETTRQFTFVGSDGTAAGFRRLPDASVGVSIGGIFVQFRGELPDTFPEYYRKLPNKQQYTSKWYQDRLRQIQVQENCTDWASCPIPEVHWNTQQVISAVYAIAYALNASLQDYSGLNRSTDRPIDGWLLKRKMHEVSIPSTSNNYFRFDDNGEVLGTYQINNFQIKNGVYEFVNVGKWDSLQETHLHVEEDKIQWRTRNGKVPISLCIEECQPGYVEVPLKKKCCWGCQKCNDYAIVVNQNGASVCQDCPVTEWPNEDFKACVPIHPSFLGYRDLVFILSIAGAGLGLILTALAAIGLCYYSEHALIKASGEPKKSENLFQLQLFWSGSSYGSLKSENVTLLE